MAKRTGKSEHDLEVIWRRGKGILTICKSGKPAKILVREQLVGELCIRDVVAQLAGLLQGRVSGSMSTVFCGAYRLPSAV
jgi:hypothetical protein